MKEHNNTWEDGVNAFWNKRLFFFFQSSNLRGWLLNDQISYYFWQVNWWIYSAKHFSSHSSDIDLHKTGKTFLRTIFCCCFIVFSEDISLTDLAVGFEASSLKKKQKKPVRDQLRKSRLFCPSGSEQRTPSAAGGKEIRPSSFWRFTAVVLTCPIVIREVYSVHNITNKANPLFYPLLIIWRFYPLSDFNNEKPLQDMHV